MQRKLKLRLRPAFKIGAGLAVSALVLAACGSSSGNTGTAGTSGTATTTTVPSHITKGGTITWALPPAVTPNWILPFASLQFFSVSNLTQFQELMYRPLYWFGPPTSTSPDVDYALSPANQPVFSADGKTITITLKGWKFHDGQTVDAQSVIFWLNMMKAESANWAGTAPGPSQFPQNILSYSAPNGATGLKVVLNLDAKYSSDWYQYNELSQISPMAEAWDVTSLTGAPASGGCGAVAAGNMTGAATMKACTAVWTFDTDNNDTAKSPQMAGDIATYASNKLWAEGVDGPWILSAFDAKSGQSTFTPNATYSGPKKPYISKFIEVPYASDTAEFNALASGSGPQVGYLPSQNTPQKPAGLGPTSAGPNASQLSGSYALTQTESWQINYFPENFNSTLGAGGHAGSVFNQLYFRQALQTLINQNGIISTYFKGYGAPTYGPAPVYPPNKFAHGLELKNGGPYPFSESKAVALLKANGWTVVPNGTTTCTKPGSAAGDCGAGIPSGTPLTFQEVYASGSQALTQVVDYEVSEWAKAGIKVSVVARPFNDVLKAAVSCYPTATKACHAWDMANWGGGWLYAPDYLPTGEEIFATGAGSNQGDYTNKTNDKLIVQTNQVSDLSIFYKWEDFLAQQLPVIWQPLSSAEPEISTKIGGVLPINALDNLNPEYWYIKG
jgi:peptide/nickel transport system substrate-binding protein